MKIVHEYDGLEYFELDGVYPVREDSIFFARTVKDTISKGKGMILDMGCGAGLISLLSSRIGWEAISVDREPLALRNTRENLIQNGLNLRSRMFLSDLFEGIPRHFMGSFDLITFNPPYLKKFGSQIDRRADLALVGGDEGFEVAGRFIEDAPRFLKDQGMILLLGYEGWNDNILEIAIDLHLRMTISDTQDIDGERFMIFYLHQ
jgi:HemK-related putative methylase